jgi:glycosyltransferase involved in cell wall biosynthesis
MPADMAPVRVHGKFFAVGGRKMYLRGVTYGPFRPEADGCQCGPLWRVNADFAAMACAGINCVRLYTIPPRWLLDTAQRHGLRVLVGIPWVQNVAFLDDRALMRDCIERVREGARVGRGHPATLGYAVGNEIPAPVVRWYGHRRIEEHLERLHGIIKDLDPRGLVTYVNYPSTEYLDLPFLDFVSFNVYLERREQLEPYLARLQNIACERPLVMAELGLDAQRNGEARQADSVEWQLRSAFRAGAAGTFAFAWTDEWHREGHDITDWKFGLTATDRTPRPALEAVRRVYAQVPCLEADALPPASVVVCTYNGRRTIRRCLEALVRLEYPDLELIVVDDGSTDDTARIAAEYPVRLIRTTNQGLSAARNTGWRAARGPIVAYTDDDAYPDPHWLQYLARTLVSGGHAGVGGPNLPVPGDGLVAECVAHSPGGPTHVLLTDSIAEHIPGCNMAFWRSALEEVGGFDPRFRIAGDDVDVCWRLQDLGGTLGFSPAAVVWHHRRGRVRGFWRQQVNYGRAEADLERKWPEKYNPIGHPRWAGRLYGAGAHQALFKDRRRVYHGVWGVAPFQHVYPSRAFGVGGIVWSLPTMPEWYAVVWILGAVCLLGVVWRPLLLAVVPLAALVGLSTLQALVHARRARLADDPAERGPLTRLRMRVLIALLYRLQPLARLLGRVHYGLTPWRLRGVSGFAWPGTREVRLWNRTWRFPAERLHAVEQALKAQGAVVMRGTPYSRWDLELRGGLVGGVRASLLTEDLPHGAQLVRVRLRPRVGALGVVVYALFTAVGLGGLTGQMPILGGVAGILGLAVVLLTLRECAAAMASFDRAARATEER